MDPIEMDAGWTVRYSNPKGEDETWHICAEIKSEAPGLGAIRRRARQKIRFGQGCYRCNQCAENTHKGIALFGSTGPLMFRCSSDATRCYPVVTEMHKLATKAMECGLENAANMRLRLATDQVLLDSSHSGGHDPDTGRTYRHFVPRMRHTHDWHTLAESKQERARMLDTALQTLFQGMTAFLSKLLALAPLEVLIERAETIKRCLGKEVYGLKTYGHAIDWLIVTLRRARDSASTSVLYAHHENRAMSRWWDAMPLLKRIQVIAEAIVRSHIGAGDDGKGVVSFDLQQSNGNLWNFLVNTSGEAQMQALIHASISPEKYKQRDPQKAPTEKDIARTQAALGDFVVACASVEDLLKSRPNNTYACADIRLGRPEPGSAAGAFGKLMKSAASKDKRKLPVWASETPYLNIKSMEELLEYMNNQEQGWGIEINTSTGAPTGLHEAGVVTEIMRMDNKYLKVKAIDDDRKGYGWCFLKGGSAHGVAGRTKSGWKQLRAGHIIREGGSDNMILVTEDAEKLWAMHNNRELLGTWILSSQGERSHGQNFKRVAKIITPAAPTGTPVIGNGLCRNSTVTHPNMFHTMGTLEWRTVSPEGDLSRTYRVRHFYKEKEIARPEEKAPAKKATNEDLDRIERLAALLQQGLISRSEFEALKTGQRN